MRRALASAAILIAFGLVAAQAQSTQGPVDHRPADNTPRQDATPSAPNENQKADQSLSNPPQSGRTEPSATNAADAHKSAPGPVFVNGALDVPGAPQDSQTRPAKFSEKNDAIDKQPILAMRLSGLDDAQRRAILAAVGKANVAVAKTQAKTSDELPIGIAIHELPQGATDSAVVKGLKYVRVEDGVLLVDAPNRIVVGEIKDER
jgi:hypothetical protein